MSAAAATLPGHSITGILAKAKPKKTTLATSSGTLLPQGNLVNRRVVDTLARLCLASNLSIARLRQRIYYIAIRNHRMHTNI
jgi:hypothetical protein